MTKEQLTSAMQIARSGRDLTQYDDSILDGIGLSSFESPVYVCIEAVARFLRWQCIYLNGGIDSEMLNECSALLRKRAMVLG